MQGRANRTLYPLLMAGAAAVSLGAAGIAQAQPVSAPPSAGPDQASTQPTPSPDTAAVAPARATGGSTEAAADQLGEIVVTARFRSENLQRTPMSISALSAAQLEARGVVSLQDFSKVTPNVTLTSNNAGSGKSALAYIRGVGQNDFLPAFEPGVGVYIDSVYQGTLFGSLADLTDIGQIEVLRGPQGTLFGKNNEGGAIRLTSTEARGDGSGYVEGGLGSYSRVQVRAAFDVALVPDTLFLRVSGGVNSMNGYIKQIDFVCANPGQAGTLPRTSPNRANGSCVTGHLGDQDSKALRANVVFKPSDRVKVLLNADYLKDNGNAGNERLVAVNTNSPLLGIPVVGAGSATGTGFGIPYDSRFVRPDFYSTYTTYTDPRTGRTFPNRNDVTSYGVTGQVNWELADHLNLTSISGYRAYHGEFTEIWSNAPIHVNDNFFRPSHHQFSEELRLAYSLGSFADFTIGGYYYNSTTKLNDFIYIPAVNFAFYGVDPVKDKDRSAFGHAVFHLTDKLSLEGGVRYSSVSKRYEFNRFLPDTGNPPATIPGFENNPSVLSKTKRPDFRASVQYQWTPQFMTYALFSTGFKGPGVNPRPNTIEEVVPFREERLRSYEAGAKFQGFGNRLRVNADGFVSDYTDLQLSIPTTGAGGAPSSIVANAGKVRISGVEAEVQAEPVRGLTFNASLGYTDFDYRSLGSAAGVANGPCASCTAAFVSKWQGNAGVQYTLPLGDIGTLTPRIDWTYRSKFYNDAANDEITAQRGYSLWNARLSYALPGNKWELSLQVLNLTDKKYYVTEFNQLSSAGYAVGTPGAPRTFFVSGRYRF